MIAPSTSTYFPDIVTNRPSTLDIALTKGVALNFNCTETLHGLLSDHRQVILKMGPPSCGRPNPTRKITNWKRVSTALEKIDTPILNSIPNGISTTYEIDFAISALTNHIRTVVEKCEWEVPSSSDRRRLPPDILELIRVKNAALRCASLYPTPEYRSRARTLQSEVRTLVLELRNENWSDLMEEITPSHKVFWKITETLKTEGYIPISPLKRQDNSVALDDEEIAECLADSIESQCSHASPPHDIAHIHQIEEEVQHKVSLEPKDTLPPVSLSEVQMLVKSIQVNKEPGLDDTSALTRLDLSEQKFLKAHPSPLLYPAYTNDILRPSFGIQLALFANDTALYYRNKYEKPTFLHLQRVIDELGRWFRTWRIEVNPKKSAAIQFKYSECRSNKLLT
ncbi:Probable RNA-directed DNA polymerase from transposon BS [Eumeta japonica]|uniref:Probable RNA-directed DNA polymerase from transposon BS n=1 Tax=Eumeta variegata TaxID=151549 RepID=A0A4C1TDZ4_EUMVA|nr:Probable RNA-directed DNA polymerase from transposon BS [Eumeta japonica]